MIEGFIDDDDMIARYKAARIIVNYGKGKTAKKQAESTAAETVYLPPNIICLPPDIV